MLSQIYFHEPESISKTLDLGGPWDKHSANREPGFTQLEPSYWLNVLQGHKIFSGTPNTIWLWRHSLNLIHAWLLDFFVKTLEDQVLICHREKEERAPLELPQHWLWDSLTTRGTLGDWKRDCWPLQSAVVRWEPQVMSTAWHSDLRLHPPLAADDQRPKSLQQPCQEAVVLTPWISSLVVEECGGEGRSTGCLSWFLGQFSIRGRPTCIVVFVLEILWSMNVSLTLSLVVLWVFCIWRMTFRNF